MIGGGQEHNKNTLQAQFRLIYIRGFILTIVNRDNNNNKVGAEAKQQGNMRYCAPLCMANHRNCNRARIRECLFTGNYMNKTIITLRSVATVCLN